MCPPGVTAADSDSDAWVEPPEEALPSAAFNAVPVAVVQTRASHATRVKYATPAAAKVRSSQ